MHINQADTHGWMTSINPSGIVSNPSLHNDFPQAMNAYLLLVVTCIIPLNTSISPLDCLLPLPHHQRLWNRLHMCACPLHLLCTSLSGLDQFRCVGCTQIIFIVVWACAVTGSRLVVPVFCVIIVRSSWWAKDVLICLTCPYVFVH